MPFHNFFIVRPNTKAAGFNRYHTHATGLNRSKWRTQRNNLAASHKGARAHECAKLDRKSEQAMADEGLATEISAWPKY